MAIVVSDYQSRLTAKDTPALTTMRALAGKYPRYGHRRIRIFLQRAVSTDRAHRLWRQAALQVPCRRQRRRVATSRPWPLPATMRNHVWADDFAPIPERRPCDREQAARAAARQATPDGVGDLLPARVRLLF